MVQFSNCKINIGLSIISKRDDGFHNLETCFYPIPLYDIVEIIHSTSFSFSNSGLIVNTDWQNNLCIKAYDLVKKDYPQITKAKIHLHKNIPMGAGIGGGSANATNTLLLLNKVFQLQIPENKLFDYAAELGSDCAFFIKNQPCLASGRGEKITPISLSLEGLEIVFIFPSISISTKEAFEQIIPQQPLYSISDVIQQPITSWKEKLYNDFEKSIFPKYPLLQHYKEMLYSKGALYASMSGSGSTIYGIFEKDSISKDECILQDSQQKIVHIKL